MRSLFLLFFLLVFLATGNAFAGTPLPTLKSLEDSLVKLSTKVFKGQDAEKLNANQTFLAVLKQALEMEGAFNYAFDSLKVIGKLDAPDKAFRIFNWNVPLNDGTHQYFGFILVDQDKVDSKVKKKKKKTKTTNSTNAPHYVLYTLTDQSDFIRNPELSTLNCDKWFGCLYYKIILNTHKGKDYYTLFGWDGNNPMTWKKLIDVLTFGYDGQPIFGEEMMFHINKISKRRVIFEFKAELTMTLKYEEKEKLIVCDVLVPEVPGAEGMRQFYVNAGTYEGYYFKKGKWIYKADLDIRNKDSDRRYRKHKPQADGITPKQ